VTDTHVHRLADGRRLAYAEWGDPGGSPCLLFHGTPGSRLFGAVFDDGARRAGLRLITPDRPGFGRSDPVERYTILGVADDALALMGGIGADRFAVGGVSGGAPYVYAAALRAPGLIPVGAIISGAAPLEQDTDAGRNTKLVAAIRSGSRSVYARMRIEFAVLRAAAAVMRHMPMALRTPFYNSYARSLPAPDRAVVKGRRDFAEIVLRDLIEATRSGARGVFQEMTALVRDPWGFDLADVTVPILLWHATEDQNALCSTAQRAAERLQRCEATYYEGEAHFMFVNHIHEIMSAIAERTR
jgi:pimeloyl-ACP methyl ester carboxylesterase